MSPAADQTMPLARTKADAHFSTPARLHLGIAVPAIVALFAIIDLTLRFLPPELFAFRAHEVLCAYRASSGPLRSNARVVMPKTFGDLANMANLPEFREYRSEIATTDAFGYRNLPLPAKSGPVRAIIIGDSFALGTGLSDQETLPARLSELEGIPIYNMASQEAISPVDEILKTADRLRVRSGVVLFQHLERKDPPSPVDLNPEHPPHRGFRAWLHTPFEYSPLKVLFFRLQRKLQNDIVFPNTGSGNARLLHLTDAQPMLFHVEEFSTKARKINIEYWLMLKKRIEPAGLRLAVFSVPNKLTVYRELISESGTLPEASPYLHDLTSALNSAGIPALDLTPRLQAAAAEGLQNHKRIYWRDDTHWNPDGALLAARELHEWLVRSRIQVEK